MRARLAIASAGFEVELREVVLRDKPREMIAVSAKATVPVLVLPDGRVIDESLDIAKYVLGLSDPELLLQAERGSLEQMLELIAQSDGPFKQSLDHYKYPNRFEGVNALKARDKACEFLKLLEEELSESDYLFGAGISFADISIFPFVRQFANVDIDWFRSMDWPNLIAALDRFTNSERFSAIMNKYDQWQPGKEVVIFGRIEK